MCAPNTRIGLAFQLEGISTRVQFKLNTSWALSRDKPQEGIVTSDVATLLSKTYVAAVGSQSHAGIGGDEHCVPMSSDDLPMAQTTRT